MTDNQAVRHQDEALPTVGDAETTLKNIKSRETIINVSSDHVVPNDVSTGQHLDKGLYISRTLESPTSECSKANCVEVRNGSLLPSSAPNAEETPVARTTTSQNGGPMPESKLKEAPVTTVDLSQEPATHQAPRWKNPNLWLTIACAIAQTSLGFDGAIMSSITTDSHFVQTTGEVHASGTYYATTMVFSLSSFVGAMITLVTAETLGRKRTILLGTSIAAIGALIQATAYSSPQVIAARILAGLGSGLISSTAPVWQVETTQTRLRGKLVLVQLAANTGGNALAIWIAIGFDHVHAAASWRAPSAIQLIMPLALFLIVPWVPESPRWLHLRGRHDEALRVLADFAQRPATDPLVQQQSQAIKASLESDESSLKYWMKRLLRRPTKDTSKIPKSGRRLLLGMGLQAMGQLSGLSFMSLLLPQFLLGSNGFDGRKLTYMIASISIMSTLFQVIGVFLVDHWGRRKLLMTTFFGESIVFFILTFSWINLVYDASLDYFAVVVAFCLFFYFAIFSLATAGVPSLYVAEINSARMRAPGTAAAMATGFILQFAVLLAASFSAIHLPWGPMGTFLFFAFCNLGFIALIFCLYPETTLRSLEDLDRYYATNPPALMYKNKKATMTNPEEQLREVDHRMENNDVNGNESEMAHLDSQINNSSIEAERAPAILVSSGDWRQQYRAIHRRT